MRRKLAAPVAFERRGDYVCITLSNGRVYRAPLVLYSWLVNASPEVTASLVFQRDRVWWTTVQDGIRIEELLLAPTTQEILEDRLTRWKRRCIIWLDSLEALVLRHSLPQLCEAISFSSWWGDAWQE